MTTLGEHYRSGHAACSLTACLNPLHPGPCKGWKGIGEAVYEKVARQSKTGIRAYNTAKGVKGGGSQRRALLSYVNGSGPINRSLRHSKGAGSNDPKIVSEINAMDSAMANSKLTHPITVQRAISPSAFGGRDTNIDLTGVEYNDHAFGSTGTDLGLILKHFHTTTSGRRPLIANITVPKGMGAIRVPPGQWGDEKEILLDRGAHFRVVKDHGFIDTPQGRFRHISLEVVPGNKQKVKQVNLGDNNQQHRTSVSASLALETDDDCSFCMQTHKPGLCKGQKRGQSEPGAQDETQKSPAQRAQVAVKGLSQAIAMAEQVATQNAATNPKLAAQARKAAAGYSKALRGHQQTLKQAAGVNAKAKAVGAQDTKQQDALDKRAQRQKDSLGKRAQAILDRRAERAKVAKMSPAQRAAYGKAKSAAAKAKHAAAEQKILKQAGKA